MTNRASSPTVYIVDDNESFVKALEMLFETVSIPVRAFVSAREFLDQYDPALPGCILLDVRMPQISGLEVLDKLNQQACNTPIIIMTGHGDVPMAVETMKKGAMDFIEKPFRDQAIVDLVRRAFETHRQRRSLHAHDHLIQQKLATLSQREAQVMEAVVGGSTNKEIAQSLGISIKTVDHHRCRVLEKMGVNSAVQLANLVLTTRNLTHE